MEINRVRPLKNILPAYFVVLLLQFVLLGSLVLPSPGLAATPPLPTGEQPERQAPEVHSVADLEGQVLWVDDAHTKALFIPRARTESSSLDSLPISLVERDVLRGELEKFRDPRWGYRCNAITPAPEQGSRADAQSMEALIREKPVAFVGEIVKVVSGWSPWKLHVAEVAYVKISELVRGAETPRAPEPGSTVGLLFFGGETVIEGTTLCRDRPEGFYAPVVGDRLLVAGRPFDTDSRFFFGFTRFPIVEGEVIAEPRADLREEEIARPLGTLVEEVRKGGDPRKEER